MTAFEEAVSRRVAEILAERIASMPWWCRLCGAGEGGPADMHPPVSHRCPTPTNRLLGIRHVTG